MNEIQNYDDAVEIIKTAILQSQYDAARSVNEKQLTLYYGIGKYISLNSRSGFWGKGAIDAISERLDKELPGLRGFSARNLRNMRTFYEEWAMLDRAAAGTGKIEGSILADAISMIIRCVIVIFISRKYEDIGLKISDFIIELRGVQSPINPLHKIKNIILANKESIK